MAQLAERRGGLKEDVTIRDKCWDTRQSREIGYNCLGVCVITGNWFSFDCFVTCSMVHNQCIKVVTGLSHFGYVIPVRFPFASWPDQPADGDESLASYMHWMHLHIH